MNSSDQPSLKEKRSNRRFHSTGVVSYATRGIAYEDFLLDISAGGVFIETQAVFTVGQALTLTFPLAGHQHYITVTGQVVRVDGRGIAVQFDEAVQELLDASPEIGI